jgi:hypothetical protein
MRVIQLLKKPGLFLELIFEGLPMIDQLFFPLPLNQGRFLLLRWGKGAYTAASQAEDLHCIALPGEIIFN